MAFENQRAGAVKGEALSASVLMQQDLLDFGADLKAYFEVTMAPKITPVLHQLAELSSNIKDVSRTAETAMNLVWPYKMKTKVFNRQNISSA